MEPLKVIYNGYEIEIRSGGCDSMPIVSMRKMVSNKPEVDEDFYKKMTEEILKGYQQQRGWWENPPMWLYPFDKVWEYTTSTTAEWTNKDSLHPDSDTTVEKIVNSVPSVWEEKNNEPLKYESYTNTSSQDGFLYVDGKRYIVNKDKIINDDSYSDWE